MWANPAVAREAETLSSHFFECSLLNVLGAEMPIEQQHIHFFECSLSGTDH